MSKFSFQFVLPMGLSYNTHWVADIRNETLNRWAFVGGSNGRSAQRDACPSKNADVIGIPVLGI